MTRVNAGMTQIQNVQENSTSTSPRTERIKAKGFNANELMLAT
jgi:hypothetical protein